MASTAQCVLLDVRSGFFYGSAEATERRSMRKSTLGNEQDIESQRMGTEAAAFEKLVAGFESVWPEIIARHAVAGEAIAAPR